MEERSEITNLYRELAKKNLKEREFSENIFKNTQFLYKDKPDFTKVQEFMNDYELEYLKSLNAFWWMMYPFVKTVTILCNKVGLCRRDKEPRQKAE